MKLLLKRTWFTDKSTQAPILINDTFECFTLEDTDRCLETGGIKIPEETAIPRGRYRVIIDWSDRFQRPMPHVLDVPQFKGIRFHILNTIDETEGCIGLGAKRGIDRLDLSAIAFNQFFKKLFNIWATGEEIWLEVK